MELIPSQGNNEKRAQFSHHVSDEILAVSRKTTMEQRFQWLEEMQNFIRAAVPIEKWKRWQEYQAI